jgi:outer membrane protein assembly factor BamB
MVEVDLGVPAEPPEVRGHRRVTRRQVVAAGMTAAVVLAALVGTRVLEDRREAADLAAFTGLPGISASLRHPLTETVRLPAGRLLAVEGDTVLARGEDGGPDLLALDARSGAERWVRDLPAAVGRPERCATERGSRVVICATGTPAAALVHLDLRDGALTATTPVPDRLVDWAVLDGDVVLAARQGDRLVVGRAAPGTGAPDAAAAGVRWQVSLPLPEEGAQPSVLLGVGDGLVAVRGAVGAVVDADDGAVLGTWAPEEGSDRVDVVLGADGFGVWRTPHRGRWFDRSGDAMAAVPGDPVTERVTDGSAPEVVLALSPLLTAVDVRTGSVLWRRGDGGYLQPSTLPLRVEGTIVVPERERLLGLDVRTGSVRWTAPAPTATQTLASRPLTDGRRLVVTDLDATGSLVLRAIDLADGTDAWVVPAPPSARWVYGLGGRGVMQGGGDVVVLDRP